jgi:hypothetical protein
MSDNTQSILLSALLSAIIFLLILKAGLDFILMFLCVIPLLAAGLGKSPKVALQAGALATVPIVIITGSPGAMTMFYLIFALPGWFICHMAMRYYDIRINATLPSIRLWYPLGLIAMYLALYSVTLLATVTALMAAQDDNLPQSLLKPAEEIISFLSKNYDIQVELSAHGISFLLISSSIWLWCLLLLFYTWITNLSLARRNMAKRPSISLSVFSLPHWLLSLMGICVLAAGIGGESMSFLGKSSLLILLIPYFFQGLAIMHYDMRNWSNRRTYLFILYATIILFVWPVVLVSCIGLWNHIKILNKHLSSGGTSSKS